MHKNNLSSSGSVGGNVVHESNSPQTRAGNPSLASVSANFGECSCFPNQPQPPGPTPPGPIPPGPVPPGPVCPPQPPLPPGPPGPPTPPGQLVVVFPASGAVLPAAQLTVSGSAAVGATVIACISGFGCYSGVADQFGNFTIPFGGELPDGSYIVTVSQQQGTAMPGIPVQVPFSIVTPAVIVGSPAPGTTVTESTPTISGNAVAGNTVTVCLNGICLQTQAGSDGMFSITFPPQPNGSHTVTIMQTSAAGSPGPSTDFSFTIAAPAQPPAPPVISEPANSSTINTARPIIRELAEPGNTVTACITGFGCSDTVADAEGNFSLEFPTPLPDGAHVLTVTQTNAYGLTSEATVVTFTVETPVVNLISPQEDETINQSSPTFVGTAVPGNTVTVCISGDCQSAVADQDGNFSITFPFVADGSYLAIIDQTSPAGSTGAAIQVNFTINTFIMDFQVTDNAMGSTFRTIDVEFSAAGAYGTLDIYYLLLPPTAPVPSVETVLTFNNELELINGGAARGVFTVNVSEQVQNFSYTITGIGVAQPVTYETGIVDGYKYVVYMVAVDSMDNNSGVSTLGNAVMAMPFAGGAGTDIDPFQIRELTVSELATWPDLQAGHPLNGPGVNQTARILENIQRMQNIFDASLALHGIINSLSLDYVLTSAFDLSGYASAYEGRGWLPIGNLDANHQSVGISGQYYFRGSFVGNGVSTAIANLTSNRQADTGEWVQFLGLFGALNGAEISNLQLSNATISANASATTEANDYSGIGALCGMAQNSTLSNVLVDNAAISGALPVSSPSSLLLGGIAGLLNECILTGVGVDTVSLVTLGGNTMSGGLAGMFNMQSAPHQLNNIEVENVALNGGDNVGSLFGELYMTDFDMTIDNCQVQGGTISGDERLGGMIGLVIAENAFLTVTDCTVNLTSMSGAGTGTGNGVGGIFGYFDFGEEAGADINNCHCTTPNISGATNIGGVIGYISYSGNTIAFTDCSSSAYCGATNSTNVGGFAGWAEYTSFLRCTASGNISGASSIGGLIGVGRGRQAVTVADPAEYILILTDCSASGVVAGSGANVGGLIGDVNNFFATGCSFTGTDLLSYGGNIGGIAGYCGGVFNIDGMTVDTNIISFGANGGGIIGQKSGLLCFASNCDTSGSFTFANNGGGIVGAVTNQGYVYLNYCSCSANISHQSSGTYANLGGIAGNSYASDGTSGVLIIADSIFNGSLAGNTYVGGIIGRDGGRGGVSRCAVISDIDMVGAGAGPFGGIVAMAEGNSSYSSNFYRGNMTGSANIKGGIIGRAADTVSVLVRIRDCYSQGTISGINYLGGICGQSHNCEVDHCYSTMTITPITATSPTAGGIAGGSGADVNGSISNSYALNTEISATVISSNLGRIIGQEDVTLSNNYAWEGILIGGFFPVSDVDGKDGADITTAQAVYPSTHYVDNSGWNFSTVWAWSSLDGVDLPILQNIPEYLQNPSLAPLLPCEEDLVISSPQQGQTLAALNEVIGQGPELGTVVISIDGFPPLFELIPEGGNFTVDVPYTLNPGSHSLLADVINIACTVTPVSVSFNIAAAPAAPIVTSPATGSVISTSRVLISGQVDPI